MTLQILKLSTITPHAIVVSDSRQALRRIETGEMKIEDNTKKVVPIGNRAIAFSHGGITNFLTGGALIEGITHGFCTLGTSIRDMAFELNDFITQQCRLTPVPQTNPATSLITLTGFSDGSNNPEVYELNPPYEPHCNTVSVGDTVNFYGSPWGQEVARALMCGGCPTSNELSYVTREARSSLRRKLELSSKASYPKTSKEWAERISLVMQQVIEALRWKVKEPTVPPDWFMPNENQFSAIGGNPQIAIIEPNRNRTF